MADAPAPEVVARLVRVTGRVQGVGFRWFTQEQGTALGVAGWVRNRLDGAVEVHVEGAPAPVERMLAWLREGPPSARVERIDASVAEPEGSTEFRIVRSAP